MRCCAVKPFSGSTPRAPYYLDKRLNLGLRDYPNHIWKKGDLHSIEWDAVLQKFSNGENLKTNRGIYQQEKWIEPKGLEFQYFSRRGASAAIRLFSWNLQWKLPL
jgi:hypothetical protein